MSPDENVADVEMCHEAAVGFRRTDVMVKVKGHIFKNGIWSFLHLKRLCLDLGERG